jgi:hypothetical protein
MTILTEGNTSLFLTTKAQIFDKDKDVAAWASKYITDNKFLTWIVGNYAEADNANSNGQYWTYEGLRMSQPTINHSPMNIGHHAEEIVGTWVASEMMLPTDQSAAVHPYIETVGAFWKFQFPKTLETVERAWKQGQLYISMETVAETVTCVGDNACGGTFPYEGPVSNGYCECIRSGRTARQLDKSHFLGGALIIPPKRPGWKAADVKEISEMTTDAEKDQILFDIAKEDPSGSYSDWEKTMWAIQMEAFKHLDLKN